MEIRENEEKREARGREKRSEKAEERIKEKRKADYREGGGKRIKRGKKGGRVRGDAEGRV